MAKDNRGIYAPGELSRVRDKLGVKDEAEAKRMAQLLGGEVGTERSEVKETVKSGRKPAGHSVETVDSSRRRSRRIDITGDDEKYIRQPKQKKPKVHLGDDPSVPVKLRYGERVKIDQYSAQMVFEIKTSLQVLTSFFSFFKEPVDYVNPRLVTVRMNEYYGKIEKLVTASRSLFPKGNKRRGNQLSRLSPFVYKFIDTLSGWNIEKLASNIAELQAHPRSVKVTDFSETLREIYKPLFILEDLSPDNIKSALKLIYKVLYLENPMDAKEKYQDVIRGIIASLNDVRRSVHFGLYPLLMKLISDRFIAYERFFIERRRRYIAFLEVKAEDQLKTSDISAQQIDNINVDALDSDSSEGDDAAGDGEQPIEELEDPDDPKVIERKALEDAERMQKKALEQGKSALEALFPKAGWDKLDEFPDLYPYFATCYNMRHGYELIARTDPVQQVSVLLNILENLFIGLRFVVFGTITGPDGNPIRVGDEIGDTLINWRRYIEDSFTRDYLPRLSEYCRILESVGESRLSPYARKIVNELHWIKRLYFLPYYKFESMGPPPFPKQNVIPIYNEIRKLRKYLTAVAMGIEQGLRNGGAEKKVICNGINNPWELYNFQVPNPVSKRLDMMLPPDKRINATLIFFSLSILSILDYIVNNENSWSYGERSKPLFRSIKDEGIIPLFGVDEKLDADQIFADNLKKLKAGS